MTRHFTDLGLLVEANDCAECQVDNLALRLHAADAQGILPQLVVDDDVVRMCLSYRQIIHTPKNNPFYVRSKSHV